MKFKVFRFKKVESTNNTAIRIIKNSNVNYGMIIADIQKRGRGQYGKKWISYKGNLFISFFFKIDYLTISLKKITTIKLGKKRSNISLFKNHSFIYSENFDFGSDLIIKDVAKLCSIDFDNSSRILTDIVFSKVESNKEIEYLDKKYFKEIPFRKITLELLIDIFNSRLDEIFEIIYDKNINLVNLKSNNVINIIVEDQELSVNINHSLDKNFSGKSKILFHKLDKDYLLSACLGATELIGKGWSKEAIPIIQSKKSTISRILSISYSQ